MGCGCGKSGAPQAPYVPPARRVRAERLPSVPATGRHAPPPGVVTPPPARQAS